MTKEIVKKKGKWYSDTGVIIPALATIGAFIAGVFGVDSAAFGEVITAFAAGVIAIVGAVISGIALISEAVKARKEGK